jgi:hypothetical protein
MKNLIIMLALLLVTNVAYSQSLAKITGEGKSLYNAICIYNNIIPGSIGMDEGRVLMQNYANSLGLKYELYEFNGGNNLYILYYDAKEHEDTSNNDDNSISIPMVGNIKLSSNYGDSATINLAAPANDYQVEQNVVIPTELIELEVVNVDGIEVPGFDKVELLDFLSLSGFTCNCQDKDVAELNKYYTDLIEQRRRAHGLKKDKLDACAYQLRKYKKVLEQEERNKDKGREKDNRIEEGYSFNQLIPDYKMGDIKTTASAPAPTKSKVRNLGKGHARTGNTGLWVKLFPFINC